MKAFKRIFSIFMVLILFLLSSCSLFPKEPLEIPHNWEKHTEHPYLELTVGELLEQYPKNLSEDPEHLSAHLGPIIFENENNDIVVIDHPFLRPLGLHSSLSKYYVYVFPKIGTDPTMEDFQRIKDYQTDNKDFTGCDLINLLGMPDGIDYPDNTSSTLQWTLIYYSSTGDKLTAVYTGIEGRVSISIYKAD